MFIKPLPKVTDLSLVVEKQSVKIMCHKPAIVWWDYTSHMGTLAHNVSKRNRVLVGEMLILMLLICENIKSSEQYVNSHVMTVYYIQLIPHGFDVVCQNAF